MSSVKLFAAAVATPYNHIVDSLTHQLGFASLFSPVCHCQEHKHFLSILHLQGLPSSPLLVARYPSRGGASRQMLSWF